MKNSSRRLEKIRQEFLRGIGIPEEQAFQPDKFQLDAISFLLDGQDTLVIAPTGAGKTYIAVEAIARIVAAGKRAVYTAPLKALSNSKYAELKKQFEPDYSVGLLTGDRKIEGDADIVVATTEIYRNELYSGGENYSLVVLDEFHYLADPQRGPVWEESVILSPKNSTLLMLSASISNPEQIADWINAVRGHPVSIVSVSERPVELRFGFLHPELGVMPLANKEQEVFSDVKRFYERGKSRGNSFKGGFRKGRGRRVYKGRRK